MDLRDFGSTLARWWWLSLIMLLASIGAAVGLYNATSPTYTANSTVLLLPPKAVLVQAQADKSRYAPNNPLLYLGTLTNSRDVLVRDLSSTAVQDELKKAAPGATITATADATSQSPLIIVKSTASTESAALAGMKAVDTHVPSSLRHIQDQMDVQSLQRITSFNVTEDAKATASAKKQIELAAVGFAIVALLGLSIIATVDQLKNRRRNPAVTGGRAAGTVAFRENTGTVEAHEGATAVTGGDRA